MIRGREIYRDIGGRIGSAKAALEDVRRRLRSVREALDENRASEGRALAALAKVRFEELEADRVRQGLDTADREVLEILETKRGEIARLEGTLAETARRDAELESERAGVRAEVDRALSAYEARLDEVEAELAEDETYTFQEARVDRALSQAEHAEIKVRQAEEDRDRKGKPYDEGRLFRYLWRRRYGTGEYRANLLFRALDGWVARLCRYHDAARDYAMLLEIPERLKAHARGLREVAGEEVARLQEIAQVAQERAGVPEIRATLLEHEQALDEVEARLEKNELVHAEARSDRARMEADQDPHTAQAVALLAAHMEREPLRTLRRDAARTQTRADDDVVSQITSLRESHSALEPEMQRLSAEQAQAIERLEELEALRRQVRKSDYDRDDSVFEGGLDMGGLLEGLLRGVLVSGQVLGKMKRHQRFELPRSRGRSPTIRFPTPRTKRSSGGGGGFRTGGGF